MTVAFFIRAYPHLFLIPQWSPEEEYNFMIVNELCIKGSTNYLGAYPVFGHLIIWLVNFLTGINSAFISQYFNPFFSALTIIPLFLFVQKISSRQTAFLASVFWAFSEAVFYRSAIFSSTETFAFFLAMFALYFYVKKQYVPTIILMCFAFYTHLLPAFMIFLTIFLHQFIIRSRKIKFLSIAILTGVVLFLFSPLNPHQRIVSVLNPSVLFNHFSLSNVFVYSMQDLVMGLTIFLGIILLGLITIISLIKYRVQNKLVFSMLIISICTFIFSWIVYSPNIFAPPRLTFYFVIPFSFYASLFIINFSIRRKTLLKILKCSVVVFVLVAMVISSICGAQTMLFYQNSVTNNEYLALHELQELGLLNINPSYWWSDYPVRISITSIVVITNSSIPITTTVNETSVINNSTRLADQNGTLNPDTIFKYVFFSERMEKESFFTVFTNNRTQQIRVPLHDVWANSSMWQLIYYNHGVKVYEKT